MLKVPFPNYVGSGGHIYLECRCGNALIRIERPADGAVLSGATNSDGDS